MKTRAAWSRLLLTLSTLGLVSSAVYGAEAALAPASAHAATQATLYASPAGSGTACSSSAPCSLTGARSAVESLTGSMTGNIVVYLMGGTYRVSSTFNLGPQDSGTNGYVVDWQAYPGQTPVLDGSQQVTGWSQYNSGQNIWRASVPVGSQARDLWVNGARASEAKSAMDPSGFTQNGASFTTSSNAYLSWSDPTEVEIVDDNPWRQLRCPLTSITQTGSGGSSLNVNQACYNATLDWIGYPINGAGQPTLNHISWIENNYALLHQPGQWFLDSSAGYLYYIPLPGQSMSSADVELPVVQDLLDVKGNPGHLTPIDSTASAISYSGSSWSLSANRGYGDFENNAYTTTNNGDSVSYSFNGSGITVLSELNSDEGNIGVYIDGSMNQTVSAYTSGQRMAENAIVDITGLTPGNHTVKLVKQSGGVMVIDAFVVIPTAIQPAHDLAFSGITFQYDTWLSELKQGYPENQTGVMWNESNPWLQDKDPGMINVERSNDVTFAGDVIQHTGDTGIDFGDGTQNSTLSSSSVLDTAVNAVQVGEVDDYYLTNTALMTTGDTITDNVITDSGVEFQSSSGVWAGYTRNLTISHNDIGFLAAAGISVGWGWAFASPDCSNCAHGDDYAGGNQVLDNYIHANGVGDGNGNSVMAGCVYTNGGQGDGNGSVYSVLAGNVCEGTYLTQGFGTITHDEGSSYWDDYDNVLRFSGNTWENLWASTINTDTIGPVNYSDQPTPYNMGTNISYTAPVTVTNGQWPPAAQAIIANAGPSSQLEPLTGALSDDCGCINYYGSSWSWSTDRGLGDEHNSVHQATSNGDDFTVQFTGTGISWTSEKSSAEGAAEVYLDGVDKGSYNAYSSSTQAQQVIFSASGLSNGAHTLQVIKTGGTDLIVDAVAVNGTATIPNGTLSGAIPSGYHPLAIVGTANCLDNYGGTSSAGAITDQWVCNGGANQEFQFVPTSGGYGELQIEGSGLDVAVSGGSTAQGMQDIVQQTVNGSAGSLWLPQQQSDGSWQFKNQNSGLCLDVYGTSQGSQLDQWPCKNAAGDNQDFDIAGSTTGTAGTNFANGYPAGYNPLTVASNGLCLDNYGGTSNTGAPVDQWACNATTNQQFQFLPVAGGYGELEIENSGMGVTVSGGSTSQGVADIVQAPTSDTAPSLWLPQRQSDGSYQFVNKDSGLCLDVVGGSSGQGVQLDQWPCKNAPGTNQDFKP